MTNQINYAQMAWRDIISYVGHNMPKAEFVRRYDVYAPQSYAYSGAVTTVLRDITVEGFRDEAEHAGMNVEEFRPLINCRESHAQDVYVPKIVSALFDVAYTRTPNNDIAPDGGPMIWDRHVNINPASAAALHTLANTDEYSFAMPYVYNEYFYPRVTSDERKVNMLSNSSILGCIRGYEGMVVEQLERAKKTHNR